MLFNGGVFKAAPVRRRVLDLLASWNDGEPVRELAGFEPDLAVAKGASFYGRNRVTGKGIRIKAGTARSYYIGLESSMPAVPGFTPPVKALCVVPQGMEEGTECLIDGREFGLVTGNPPASASSPRRSAAATRPARSCPTPSANSRKPAARSQSARRRGLSRRPGDPGQNQPGRDRNGQPRAVDEAHQLRPPLEGRVPGPDRVR